MWDGARERRLGRKYLKVTIIYRYILGVILELLSFCKYSILLLSLVSEMTNHSIVVLTRLQASTNLFVCTKFCGFVLIRKNFKYWYLQKNSHLKVRNRKRRGHGED